jgi:hypothetical protein
MNRLDVYGTVHKMQRGRLFKLTVEAGRVDPTDSMAAARLACAVESLTAELLAHAEHEERFIHPLLRAHAPDLADALDAAHIELDVRLDRLRHVATAYACTPDAQNRLYRALAGFAAAYLDHLAVEEDEALPALWEGCSDTELSGILAAFKGSRSDVQNLTSLLAQLPVLGPAEMAGLVAVSLPAPVSEVAELLASLLEPHQLGALRTLD